MWGWGNLCTDEECFGRERIKKTGRVGFFRVMYFHFPIFPLKNYFKSYNFINILKHYGSPLVTYMIINTFKKL